MATKIIHYLQLEVINCADCGMPFAITDHLIAQLRRSGETFYCPTGHCNVFRESEVERLKKQAKEAQALLDQQKIKLSQTEANARFWMDRSEYERLEKEAVGRKLSATKGALTRTKKRVAAGVCPCCNRCIGEEKLQRHLKTKHPDWPGEEVG